MVSSRGTISQAEARRTRAGGRFPGSSTGGRPRALQKLSVAGAYRGKTPRPNSPASRLSRGHRPGWGSLDRLAAGNRPAPAAATGGADPRALGSVSGTTAGTAGAGADGTTDSLCLTYGR